jgi:rhodanese-related sulfurtransferase
MAQEPHRTTYLFDVRLPEDHAAGHVPGAQGAPGGQLVQETDRYAAVRNARIVLLDDDGVRATLTASWLVQMGWPEVFAVDVAAGGRDGKAPAADSPAPPLVPTVDPAELAATLESAGVTVLDFGTSIEYRKGHIPGAAFAIRARLAGHLGALAAAGEIVCTSSDGAHARWAAADLAGDLGRPVRALAGGTAAWRDAGHRLEEGQTRMLEPPEDVYYKPYDGTSQVEAAMQDYLQWELGLLEQIRRDSDCNFRRFA